MCSTTRCVVKEDKPTNELPLIHRQEMKKLVKEGNLVVFSIDEDGNDYAPSVRYPNGIILSMSEALSADYSKYGDKHLIFVCPGQTRSAIVAAELAKRHLDARALAGGLAAWNDPINCSFDYVVILGHGLENIDRCCTCLSMACVAQKSRNTCLILVSNGVTLAEKGALKGDETPGAPFLTIGEYIKQYLEDGGVIFTCTSCVLLRKIKEKLEDYAVMCSAPDVIRWTSSCKGSLQFA